MKRGYLYIAIGGHHTQLFALSLGRLRRSDPTTPVAVVSDLLPESDAYRLIRSHVGTGFETRALKTSLDALTPFEQTLFMDVDTLAI
ncbi:MAG TPA: hypothetical protein VHM19_06015, partial [Polyangiales bacterium]|nr:hypothetical protein [Polyangiales bacterium]